MNATLIEYNALNLHQKATLLGKANFLVRHLCNGIIYSLYTYKDFYIELGVDAATKYILILQRLTPTTGCKNTWFT